MSSNKSEISDLQLIKYLIELNGLSISKAAKVMGIQRSNLSSWLNGKPNVFSATKIEGMMAALGMCATSEPLTGIRVRYLSPDIVHRWQVEAGAQSLIEVLRATEPEDVLEGLAIFQVNISQQGRFVILRSAEGKKGGWMMFVANRDLASKDYPLSPEMLGLGKLVETVEIPVLKWVSWWKEKSLTMAAHLEGILEVLYPVEIDFDWDCEIPEENKKETGFLFDEDDLFMGWHPDSTEEQLLACERTVEELKATIQKYVDELRRVDPGNFLLVGHSSP